MVEVLGAVVFVLVIGLAWRRRRRMSPEQREIDDLQRDVRRLKREARRHRYD